jgi:rifampin ADP-ribosylating transferase
MTKPVEMKFDPNNHVIKLCAQGMEMEGKGECKQARELFLQAWNKATNDFEKFTAAHYVARHQKSIDDKLKWDQTALQLALNINDARVKVTFPSLYLNIAKCYEDLNDLVNAKKNYDLALSFANLLPDNGFGNGNGYGNMIKNAITKGIERVTR